MNILKSLFGASGSSLSATEAKRRIDGDESPFVLDVRQPDEFRSGHIPGAKLIPLGQLGASLGKLPQNRAILCVCQSGSRSSAAVRQLSNAGYNAINLSGGMIGWRRAGFPVSMGR